MRFNDAVSSTTATYDEMQKDGKEDVMGRVGKTRNRTAVRTGSCRTQHSSADCLLAYLTNLYLLYRLHNGVGQQPQHISRYHSSIRARIAQWYSAGLRAG
jgi:hypothetical protein